MRIVVRQMSGLGNQMFQYAAGLYYAQKYRAELEIAVDPDEQASSAGFPRPFQLSRFCITTLSRRARPLERLIQAQNPRLRPAANLLAKLLNTEFIEEPKAYRFHPDLPVRSTANTVHIRGYWQAAPYVEAVADRLRSDLVLREAPTGRNREVLQEIKGCTNPVSLHVRGGDYLLANRVNLLLPFSYYQTAIRTISELTADPTFFVFSDDIEFARTQLPADIRSLFVDHNSALTAYEDLRLMSTCRHHIIANSSFSWWGAWLNPNPEKIVVAPKYWLAEPNSYYADLFPANWILVDNL